VGWGWYEYPVTLPVRRRDVHHTIQAATGGLLGRRGGPTASKPKDPRRAARRAAAPRRPPASRGGGGARPALARSGPPPRRGSAARTQCHRPQGRRAASRVGGEMENRRGGGACLSRCEAILREEKLSLFDHLVRASGWAPGPGGRRPSGARPRGPAAPAAGRRPPCGRRTRWGAPRTPRSGPPGPRRGGDQTTSPRCGPPHSPPPRLHPHSPTPPRPRSRWAPPPGRGRTPSRRGWGGRMPPGPRQLAAWGNGVNPTLTGARWSQNGAIGRRAPLFAWNRDRPSKSVKETMLFGRRGSPLNQTKLDSCAMEQKND